MAPFLVHYNNCINFFSLNVSQNKETLMSNIVIIGQGGIGTALAEHYRQQHHQVITVSRQASDNKHHLQCDCTDAAAVDRLFEEHVTTLPDILVNTIGILHDEQHQPEKALSQLQAANITDLMTINIYPTLHLAKAINQRLHKDSQVKFVTLSARIGSISDNQLGGWHSYRISKAALNMLVKNIAVEWHRRFKQASIMAYHPGTVATNLSAPFQKNVPANQLFSPEKAANYLSTVIAKITPHDSGNLIDWAGKTIAP